MCGLGICRSAAIGLATRLLILGKIPKVFIAVGVPAQAMPDGRGSSQSLPTSWQPEAEAAPL